ncbi:DUF1002 domain-containing protein [Streptococcus sp.]|nr:DUF1002 domain-containing protein [Streptococcus sp.]MDY3824323.1 DUF1002 domain-containing protein [Streptococcus sp.]
MNFKKIVYALSTAVLAFTSFTSVLAAESSQVQTVIDEAYVQPDYVLGYSLSEEQQAETLSLLGYDSSQDTQVKLLTTDAYSQIMDVDGSSLQLYSSVKIQKLGSTKALEVEIITPENITKVTEDMYRNAAITLGIEHAKISVASPIAVTGESALAGIYYSLEENGVTVSSENKNLASEELSLLSTINEENQGKEGYDTDKLNVALTDIKSALAESSNQQLTEEQVRKIVEDTLSRYGLTESMTSQQITLIVNFAVNLSKSDIINTDGFKKSVSSLKDSIISQAKSTFEGINLNFSTDQALESVKGFLSNIWQAIVNFFTNLFT